MRYIGSSASSQITNGSAFASGNQTADSMFKFMQSIGGTRGSAPAIFSLDDIKKEIDDSNWDFEPSFSAASPASGGSLTINSNAIGNYDFVKYDGNTTLSSFTNSDWFTTTKDTAHAMVYVNGNLTINSGITLIPSHRKLGLYIFVDGDLTVTGSISMTKRGANHSGTGDSGGSTTKQDIRLIDGTHGSYTNPTIPATGSTGGPRKDYSSAYTARTTAPDFGTSGGHQGNTAREYLACVSGAGADGTCFGGGAGGGSARQAYYNNATYGGDAVANGGKAGSASHSYYSANGSSGNPGSSASGGGESGDSGTGGVIVIYCTGTISGAGSITSKGGNGGDAAGTGRINGVGSGGGMITVFCGTDSFTGTINTDTGTGIYGSGGGGSSAGFNAKIASL
jgi:hypothetical protein